jgi:hypothetical protein
MRMYWFQNTAGGCDKGGRGMDFSSIEEVLDFAIERERCRTSGFGSTLGVFVPWWFKYEPSPGDGICGSRFSVPGSRIS